MGRICTWTQLWVTALRRSMTLSGMCMWTQAGVENLTFKPRRCLSSMCTMFAERKRLLLPWPQRVEFICRLQLPFLPQTSENKVCCVSRGKCHYLNSLFGCFSSLPCSSEPLIYSIPGFVGQNCTSLSLKFLPLDHLNSSHQNQFCTLPPTFISTYLRLKIKLSQADWKFNTLIDFDFPSILLPNWPF